ncbi:hypothetical protein [Paenibacillus sp. SI8]|uniref:hypothetical protein n=1 Tax=unclassified Paenibacillus TaxID=185978 RepID=UPI0034652950
MELQAYLENLVAISHFPITFAGDVPNALSRWLVRSIVADNDAMAGTEPILDLDARLLLYHELALLDKEVIEANWRQYTADMIDRYQEVNTPSPLFTVQPNKFMYALNTVYCEQERDTLVNVITYFPTPVRMWINGELVVTGNHNYLIKDYFFMCRFREGSNTVLLEWPLSLHHPVTNQEFIVKLNPVSSILQNAKGYIDEDLQPYYKQSVRIFPESVYHALGEPIRFVVLPQYCNGSSERIRIRLYTATGELLHSQETASSRVTIVPSHPGFAGLLRIYAESMDGGGKSGETYVFFGDFDCFVEELLMQVAGRGDCDPAVLTTIKEMMGLPKVFKSLNQYVPDDIYKTIFPVLEKGIQYACSPEAPGEQGHMDIFGSSYTVFERQPNSDRLAAYTIFLPEDYDPLEAYPLVVYFHDAQARSFPTDLPWVKRRSTSSAIIVSLVGIGRLNYVDDFNVIQRISSIAEQYHVDRNRIHLIGFCTGGPKTYRIAMQVPDAFAGIASIVGDMRLRINDPEYELLDNLSNMAVMGMMSTENWFFNSTRKLQFLKELPKAMTGMFHGFMHNEFNALLNSKVLLDKLISFRRDSYPKEVKLSPLEPGYNKAYWVKVEMIENLQEMTYVHATRVSAERINIQMQNISVLSLLLSRVHMSLSSSIEVSVNGVIRRVGIADACKLVITLENNMLRVDVLRLASGEFEQQYHAIGIDIRRMGMKQIYLSACTIIKPDSLLHGRRSLANKLAYLLQNPMKDRYIYYKYESCTEEEFDWDQADSGDTNFVLLVDVEKINEKQQELLNKLQIHASKDKLVYNDQIFNGVYFTFILCRHPMHAERLLLIVAYNNNEVECEMITWMNSLDTNPLFYNDAVVFHEGKYHGFRDRPNFLSKGENNDATTYVGQNR